MRYRLKRPRPVHHSYRISLLSAVLAVSFAEQGLAEGLVTQDLAAQNIEITGQALSETEDALVAGRRAKAELDTQVS
ncbi:MAG: hypothetical protein VCB06_06695, partial [Alphaproteobacteria bacterium]